MIETAKMSGELITDFLVTADLIDLNRHPSDMAYHNLFSKAEGQLHGKVEIDDDE